MCRHVPPLGSKTRDRRQRGLCASARDKIVFPSSRDGPRSACGSQKQASRGRLGRGVDGVRRAVSPVMVAVPGLRGAGLCWQSSSTRSGAAAK